MDHGPKKPPQSPNRKNQNRLFPILHPHKIKTKKYHITTLIKRKQTKSDKKYHLKNNPCSPRAPQQAHPKK